MATDATVQVLATSVDSPGLSIVTSTMTAAHPRYGTAYTSTVLAGSVPVYFHPLADGTYLALLRTHWSAATMLGSEGPQSYSAYTSSSEPTWAVLHPATGSPGAPGTIPTRLSGYTSRRLNGACSRVDFLYTVGIVDGVGYAAWHRVTRNGAILLMAEETLAVTAGSVTFGYGCHLDGDFLVVIGLGADGAIYQARRRWSNIGSPSTADPWFYRGPRGWLADPTTLSPLTDAAGATLHSSGPVSTAQMWGRTWMTTVTHTGGAYAAQLYRTRTAGTWATDGDPIALGTDAEYLGGTVFLQPQLPNNPAALAVGVTTAIPYVSSRSVHSGGAYTLDTQWGLWAISR